MKNKDAFKQCELCSLPVTLNAFTQLSKDKGMLYFCCEGCKNIYRLLHADEIQEAEQLNNR
jgi:hypothetical protein